jgi:hypothetical protein
MLGTSPCLEESERRGYPEWAEVLREIKNSYFHQENNVIFTNILTGLFVRNVSRGSALIFLY